MATLTGKMLLNRYRVDEFVGRGGMAEVYKVWDAQRMTFLAMKVLNQDLATDKIFVRRFQREARTLSKLQHPNIVRFYGFEQEGRIAFMLLDYVDGEALKLKIFDADKPFSAQATREIIRPVISALQFAHSQGMVHCDIKPGNIMINKHGQVMLADFGISRMSDAATATMVGMGTPAYIPPEQARGLDPVPQSDIYALGIVIFELLTGGERPFTGESANTTGSTSERVRWEQINLPPPSPRKWNSAITPELEAVVMKCLAKNPSARFQSPVELLNTLEMALPEDGHQPAAVVEQMAYTLLDTTAAPQPQLADRHSPITNSAGDRLLQKALPERSRRIPWLLAGAMAVVALGALLFSGDGQTDPLTVTQTTLAGQQTQTALAFAALLTNTQIPTFMPTFTITPTPTVTSTFTLTPTLTPSLTPSHTNTPTYAPTALGGGSGKIAFVSGRDGDNEIYIRDISGNNLQQLTFNDVDEFDPSWSHDGNKLVFASNGDGVYGIYVINIGEGIAQKLVDGSDPKWSPDGQWIAFKSNLDGNLFIMDAFGNDIQKLTNHGVQISIYRLAWSPDSASILYSLRDSQSRSKSGFYITDLNGNDNQILFYVNPNDVAWAPDGETIVVEANTGGRYHHFVYDLESLEIIDEVAQDHYYKANMSWSPDGQRFLIDVFGERNEDGVLIPGHIYLGDIENDSFEIFIEGSSNGVWQP